MRLISRIINYFKSLFRKTEQEEVHQDIVEYNSLESNLNNLNNNENTLSKEEIDKLKNSISIVKEKMTFINNILSTETPLDIPYEKFNELDDLITNFKTTLILLYGAIYGNESKEEKIKYKKGFLEELYSIDYFYKNLSNKIYKRLIISGNKSVVISGQFSSGKTSFMNKIFNLNLPVKITRTTALPTYISYSIKNHIEVENYNQCLYISNDKSILKNFEYSDQNDGTVWSNIVNRIHYLDEGISSHGITFIDLPGYSGSDRDYKITLEEALAADGIIFLVSLSKGDLTSEDIIFLKEINNVNLPLLIILSQIDSQPLEIVNQIEKAMYETLKREDIKYVNFIKYSASKKHLSEIKDIINLSDIEINKFFDEIKNKQPELDELKDAMKSAVDGVTDIIKDIKANALTTIKINDLFADSKSLLSDINSRFSSYIERRPILGDKFKKDKFSSHYFEKLAELINCHNEKIEKDESSIAWESNLYFFASSAVQICIYYAIYNYLYHGHIDKENPQINKQLIEQIDYIKKMTQLLLDENPRTVYWNNYEEVTKSYLDEIKSLKKQILIKYKEVFEIG